MLECSSLKCCAVPAARRGIQNVTPAARLSTHCGETTRVGLQSSTPPTESPALHITDQAGRPLPSPLDLRRGLGRQLRMQSRKPAAKHSMNWNHHTKKTKKGSTFSTHAALSPIHAGPHPTKSVPAVAVQGFSKTCRRSGVKLHDATHTKRMGSCRTLVEGEFVPMYVTTLD